VYQASGMISVQAECSLDAALLLLIERAHEQGLDWEAVALDVVEGRVRFEPLAKRPPR